jgi:hypothetical protein
MSVMGAYSGIALERTSRSGTPEMCFDGPPIFLSFQVSLLSFLFFILFLNIPLARWGLVRMFIGKT